MTINEVQQIFTYNQTNQNIVSKLNEEAIGLIADILSHLSPSDFVELNPNASESEKQSMFTFLDVPLPLDALESRNARDNFAFSPEIHKEIDYLITAINSEGTNVEFPYAFYGQNNQYQHFERMYDPSEIEKLGRQSVEYDSDWINQYVANNNNSILALVHTHPASLGKQHNTLFNKYSDVLSDLGVKPDGLNLSLADVNTQLVVDNALQLMGKNIDFESIVLMHDGTLVSFSTKNGLCLTAITEVAKHAENRNDFEINEFGEIVRTQNQNSTPQSALPPQPEVSPVSLNEIRPLQEEMFPESYGAQQIELIKYQNEQAHEQDLESTKEV